MSRMGIQWNSNSGTSTKVILSYVLDWAVLVAVGVISYLIGELEPHKRPFSLTDPNISLPYRETEAVPLWLLGVLVGAFPVLTILIITFVLVPGPTTPRHTPAAVIWRRKLWELHIGILGLIAANIIAFFFTQGMKNLFGKPRPDLLDRCQPDFDNTEGHAVGGPDGILYYASICQQTDADILDDGFRSYPSGHSSASAAGLIYLSLFLASKLAVVVPFVLPSVASSTLSPAAYPSRMIVADPLHDRLKTAGPAPIEPVYGQQTQYDAKLQSLRTQAAAPPLYLLAIVLAPFALSIYISASRWFDFRHHGFDIIFGYLIGMAAAVYCFRYFHLPIAGGAGWAWGPRSHDRAFWAGVGTTGYTSETRIDVTSPSKGGRAPGTANGESDSGEEDVSSFRSQQPMIGRNSRGSRTGNQRPDSNGYAPHGYATSASRTTERAAVATHGDFDVEMQQLGERR